MKTCRAVLVDSGQTVLEKVRIATGLWDRFRGLMLKQQLPAGEGLLLTRCKSVHTCFMRFPIDVVYLAADGKVLKVVEAMKPYRVSSCAGADSTLEAQAGQARAAGVKAGERLVFEPVIAMP
jgi:hypothetical protein